MDQKNKNNAWLLDAASFKKDWNRKTEKKELKQKIGIETDTEKLEAKTMLDFQMWLNLKKLKLSSAQHTPQILQKAQQVVLFQQIYNFVPKKIMIYALLLQNASI